MKKLSEIPTVPVTVHGDSPQDLKDELSDSVVKVRFIKKSTGEERIMYATNHPYVTTREGIAPKNNSEHKRPENLVTTYDLERQGWRTFYYENVLDAESLNMNISEQVAEKLLNNNEE